MCPSYFETGKAGNGVGSCPIQTISLQIFYTLEINPIWKLSEKFIKSVLSSRPTTTPVPRQSLKINYTVSMGDFVHFQICPICSIDKHFSSQT
jgi:hypothetical protein